MVNVYRIAAPRPVEPRLWEWKFDEFIRRGVYYVNPLAADRWTTPHRATPRMGPVVAAQRFGVHRHTRFVVLSKRDLQLSCCESDTFLAFAGAPVSVASNNGFFPATLAELLLFGIEYPGHPAITYEGSRLFGAGSYAWQHWQIDQLWTAGIPYLANCAGRARVCPIGKVFRAPEDMEISFLFAAH